MSDLQELIENFALFTDWEERYGYLIELGKTLTPMDEALKAEATLVKGCTSRVWLMSIESGGVYHFTADSDAHIVRGLSAVILCAYQDKTSEEIKAVDIEAAFKDIGLHEHLSPNRRNGFFAMVEKIRSYANVE